MYRFHFHIGRYRSIPVTDLHNIGDDAFILRLLCCRLTASRLDPSIPPPTPHCLVAREANMPQEAAAEGPARSLPLPPLHPLPALITLPCVSTELSRLTNSLLTCVHPSPPSATSLSRLAISPLFFFFTSPPSTLHRRR